jgi:hypothetical protein
MHGQGQKQVSPLRDYVASVEMTDLWVRDKQQIPCGGVPIGRPLSLPEWGVGDDNKKGKTKSQPKFRRPSHPT